jgi:SAM-dependent methyltransferase
MRGSSSVNSINGDRPLGVVAKLGYLALNWGDNLIDIPPALRSFEVLQFRPGGSPSVDPAISLHASPSRFVSDLFWASMPWRAIAEELGGLRVIDLGCGSGEYLRRIAEVAAQPIDSWLGIDQRQQDSWNGLIRDFPQARFVAASCMDLPRLIGDKDNLVISQSALEHFETDAELFEALAEVIAPRRTPVVQVHLAPSPAGLGMFLWHGFRQYNYRKLSRLLAPFSAFSRAYVVLLGHSALNRLHRRYVTYPHLFGYDGRVRHKASYEENLRLLAVQDGTRHLRSASFLAFIIHSHPRSHIRFGGRGIAPLKSR